MKYELNPLERKALKTFGKGMIGSFAVAAAECLYVIPQKPYWSLSETIALGLTTALPAVVSAVPLFRKGVVCYHGDEKIYQTEIVSEEVKQEEMLKAG